MFYVPPEGEAEDQQEAYQSQMDRSWSLVLVLKSGWDCEVSQRVSGSRIVDIDSQESMEFLYRSLQGLVELLDRRSHCRLDSRTKRESKIAEDQASFRKICWASWGPKGEPNSL